MNHLVLAEIASGLGGSVTPLTLRLFDSARDAVADVLGNHSDIAVVSAASALPEMKTGALTAISVSSPERLGGVFSVVPTSTELGVPSVRGTWRGLVGPPGLEERLLAGWDRALSAVTASGRWKQSLAESLWLGTFLDSSETRPFLDSERVELAALLESIGLTGSIRDG
jgi:putative tricarboxylic transport membrane protein